MNTHQPTRPNPPHLWEEGSFPPLRRCAAQSSLRHAADPDKANRIAAQLRSLDASAEGPALHRQFLILLFSVFVAVSSYYALSRYVITAVVVQGRSMVPTLADGDRYFLNRWAFWVREPRRGDLVVIRDAGHHDYAVKRIVGMPNEVLEIRDGRVRVNGEWLAEPYLYPETATQTTTGKGLIAQMGPDQFFVMGDNRAYSEDSRYYGALKRAQIVGLLVK